jgi:hypothetical protein
MIGGGIVLLLEASSESSDSWAESRVRTLEWKCGLVTGIVIMLY